MILEHGPSETKDLSVAKANLDKYGYCLISEALNADEVKVCRERLLEQAEAEEELGLSFRDGGAKQEIRLKEGKVDRGLLLKKMEASIKGCG